MKYVLKQKIKLSYAKTNKKNFFWGELCNCYVVRATIHPTKFAYEAYPFSDRMENDLLEKIMSLTKHSYDEGETWYELSKKLLNRMKRGMKIKRVDDLVLNYLN